MGLEEQRDEQVLDLMGRAGDLLVAVVLVGPDGGQFDAVEGALAGQGLASIGLAAAGFAGGVRLADDGGQQRIVAEVVMVVEVLVAQGQAVDPLGDEVLQRVLDQVGVTMIGEAVGELADDPGELLDLPEQAGPRRRR